MSKKITQNVNKDKLFNDLPEVHPQYSKWKNRHSNYQSCNMGEIVPIYYAEVLPGEKKKITMGMISHTVTPIAPIFNATYTELRCFVIPMRLCADLLNGYKERKSPWVKVFGEDNASSSADIVVPLQDQKLPDVSSSFVTAFENYCGNAENKNNVVDSLDLYNLDYNEKGDSIKANFLQLAAYELVYQRHYRNENYESATESPLYRFLFDAYNSSNVPNLPTTFTFEKANREKDYFTGAKPFTQKSSTPVKVGLAGNAEIKLGRENGTINAAANVYVSPKTTLNLSNNTAVAYAKVDGSNQASIYADLSTASGISIEDLRIMIKTQELLEKDMMYGSLYAESLNAHFGTCPLDLTLQDPQELFKFTVTSNMQAIFQTSSTNGESSILGTIGANSTTQTDPFVILPETKFNEHSILMICAVHKLQNVYDSRFYKPRFISKKARFDFYTPELNDLGYQPLGKVEFLNSTSTEGYNEAFAEYRYVFNKLHGSLATDFPYWAPSISDEYSSISALYKESPSIFDKALSVRSSTSPQFFDAWGFEEECTKPMSLHSIPGMDGVI